MTDEQRRRIDDHRPAVGLQWDENNPPPRTPIERPEQWTILLTSGNHGLVGAYGHTFPHAEGDHERINVVDEAVVTKLRERVSELEAARMAYASEFPLLFGEPDVGSIHANIRALKAKLSDSPSTAGAANDLEALRKSTPFAYVATDLDGHADVGMTIEQAKRRAGHGCDTVIALHDISAEFVEFGGEPVAAPALNPSDVRDKAHPDIKEELRNLIECANDAISNMRTWMMDYGDDDETHDVIDELSDAIDDIKDATGAAAQSVEGGEA